MYARLNDTAVLYEVVTPAAKIHPWEVLFVFITVPYYCTCLQQLMTQLHPFSK